MRLCVLLRSVKLTAKGNNTLTTILLPHAHSFVLGTAVINNNADNQNISFLLAIMSTSTSMHGEFLRFLFLQAHRETEAHVTDAGMSSQRNQPDSFPFKRAAFYQLLKGKVGLAAAKAAALRTTSMSRAVA